MALPLEQTHCPDCGTRLSDEPWARGLCVPCLADLAEIAPSLHAELAFDPDEPPTLRASAGELAGGQILGSRYRIRSLLGRGGMGEVWRAFDLKLRVDVALKALRGPLLEREGAIELLRREVRSAREVVSPNVCRVFHIEEVEEFPDRELVSMEYIDGQTLTQLLRARSPLDLGEAREIAAQFLAGLEAIHAAGLVHRDFKPENVMITRSGRVVVMDFGIAKGLADASHGTVSGTPAYMAPEQALGETVDARADVFSAGVVLAEMVTTGGVASREERMAVTQGVHREPPTLAETPWRRVLEKAVARNREDRYTSAAELARALEEVTLRVEGAEDLEPYPGLATFTQSDAKYFFGRELEVEEMWRKLRRPHLLALIGPSGAGKSSFLRAGLLPAMPEGWRAVIASPGNRPFVSLGEPLADELSGDSKAIREFLRFEDLDVAVSLVARWRQRHDHALVILDQFEELFTQNPIEVQERFAELLGRLTLEADVHVLLAMRDDFLFHSQPFESLRPILSELTLLGTLSGSGLRRALVQPALRCGYRFEDDALVDEMVAEVNHERGALPMLAFAAKQLWEHRDRGQSVLTREAYEHVGGVGGALARHAEATLETIGSERVALVRELFRNLVTAEGTRASRSRAELLSVFTEDSEAGEEVLDALIDARLLTTYELAATGDEEAGEDRVEIVHESLLKHWPRLVRWRDQDAEGAHVRDELRHAAQMWEQHDRSADLLWTGTTYREFELWRERYPGGLMATEEAFAEAMIAQAGRRRRRRRLGVAAVIAVLLSVASVVTSLWRQSVAQTRRAEAAVLLSQAQRELDRFPTAAVAYALRSLELADTETARLLALRALQKGPTAVVVNEAFGAERTDNAQMAAFSPEGESLAVVGVNNVVLRSRSGGLLGSFAAGPTFTRFRFLGFVSPSRVLVSNTSGELGVWSLPGGDQVERTKFEKGPSGLWITGRGAFTLTTVGDQEVVRWWSLDGKETRVVGRMEATNAGNIDESGQWLAYRSNTQLRSVYYRSLVDWTLLPRQVGEHEHDVKSIAFQAGAARIAALDDSGEIRFWSMESPLSEPARILQQSGLTKLYFNSQGTMLAAGGMTDAEPALAIWDLSGPSSPDPLLLVRPDKDFHGPVSFDPSGRWLATSNRQNDATLWPLSDRYATVLTGHSGRVTDLAFSPDGTRVFSGASDGTIREWPLEGDGPPNRVVFRGRKGFQYFDLDPSGERLLVVDAFADVLLVTINDGAIKVLEGLPGNPNTALTFGPNGRLAAVGTSGVADGNVIRIWDLESGKAWNLGPAEEVEYFKGLRFAPDGDIFSLDLHSVRRWDLADGSHEKLDAQGGEGGILLGLDGDLLYTRVTEGGRRLVGELVRLDLEDGTLTLLSAHGESLFPAALDPSGSLVATGDEDGIVRVGPTTGEEPHLLFGHEGLIREVAFSPDGRWIASGGDDMKVRIWPVPRGRPFHTLPLEELLERLRAVTNLRAVDDEESPSGYRIEVGPFPGWETFPQWWDDDPSEEEGP